MTQRVEKKSQPSFFRKTKTRKAIGDNQVEEIRAKCGGEGEEEGAIPKTQAKSTTFKTRFQTPPSRTPHSQHLTTMTDLKRRNLVP